MGQDVLLSCLNLLRFVLLRDRPTPDHPAGMTGVWSEESRRQLAVRQNRHFLRRFCAIMLAKTWGILMMVA